ncbi:unnamed protein product [Paramecium sonneborni]|uniref:Uncharacterized protein n=1 Tax=Paramecium sonneborni TaxID=65129 RepID=A0A8S1RH24_9CILI|nr:unnamed protein product [Paramecium sonneborni]
MINILSLVSNPLFKNLVFTPDKQQAYYWFRVHVLVLEFYPLSNQSENENHYFLQFYIIQ